MSSLELAGLSPRVRGNPLEIPMDPRAFVWQSSSNYAVYPRACGGTPPGTLQGQSFRSPVYPRACGGTGER